MQKLEIHKLGPINDCELQIEDMMILTGAQASGKSTVAKSIFFFRNIPNLLEQRIRKMQYMNGEEQEISLKNRLLKDIRLTFLQIFGSTWCMNQDMLIKYEYSAGVSIGISLIDDPKSPNYIWISLEDGISNFLQDLEGKLIHGTIQEDKIHGEIAHFFDTEEEVVYIPAGRSMLTLLSNQLNYIYGSMDDAQKRELDYCTQNYLERILKMKNYFSKDIEDIIKETKSLTDIKIDKIQMQQASSIIQQILQGSYRNVNGEERLQLQNGHYIKINFASSGQQEAVWILNVLFYYLINDKKAYFIIEEPESHLFPNAQKLITEFISLAKAQENKILLTTHSPYVLGTLNNLLYASQISRKVKKESLDEIVHPLCRIDSNRFASYYAEHGELTNCMDEEEKQMIGEVIDGASKDINIDYDRMLDLVYGEE